MVKQNNFDSSKSNVVVIGGGTGTFVVLSGLKKYPLNLSAVVTMMDSGGSTGRLRDQLGVLPPGDVRQALVALSSSQKIWRDLFTYRFSEGDLKGHNFGNIFLSALEKITGSIEQGLDLAADILDARGQVIPVTLESTQLCVEYSDGTHIKGETHIDENPENKSIIKSYLFPPAKANPQAKEVIENADYIIMGPGDLYTSIIPNLLVDGIAEALKKSKAKKIYNVNLMTKVGQTTGLTASDHVHELERHADFMHFDYILINNGQPSNDALDLYLNEQEKLVVDDLYSIEEVRPKTKIIRANFLDSAVYIKGRADSLKRSLIRHNSDKLAEVLFSILERV